MEKLVEQLGINRLSKSPVSVMAKDLDAQVETFRTLPLDAGPYTYLAADALTLKVRDAGRVVNVACLVATGVNATATARSSAWRSVQLSSKPAGCSSSAA
jgi:putative transposase